MHAFSTDYLADDGARRGSARRFHRGYWLIVRGTELHAEVVVPTRVRPEFGVRFHLGTLGSETPVDAHAGIGGVTVYLSTSAGRRLAHALTWGEGRDLSLRLDHGQLWWRLWVNPDASRQNSGWRAAPWSRIVKYRPYLSPKGGPFPAREGNVSVNVLDHLRGGPLRYSYEDVGDPQDAPMTPAEGYDGDGPYLIHWQLQRQTLARPRGPKRLSWTAAWECRPGIPVRNHDWKGDEVLSSSVVLTDAQATGDWVAAATGALVAGITTDREHYQYRWPGAEHYPTREPA